MASKENSALIVGSGGREHQLAMSVAGSVDTIYATGDSAGIAAMENTVNLGFGASALGHIVGFANEKKAFSIVGSEIPLVRGLADRLRECGLVVFGPGAEGARLEGSKYFASEFNQEFGILQPETRAANNFHEAMTIIGDDVTKWVIKADGLASGKGVIPPETEEDAGSIIKGMLEGSLADGAGKDCILLQERLGGPEVSVTVICDGKNFMVLPNSQDHKRLLDGDKGPNTGGMGAYAPLPASIVSANQQAK